MTLSVPHVKSAASNEARRASEAYRMAERLGRTQRYSSEWRRLCRADRTRQSLYAFRDVFDDEAAKDELEPRIIKPENDGVRSAYFLSAVAAGTLCLLLGTFLIT